MASWRQMSPSDIDGVLAVGNKIHFALPESRKVYAERVALFPQGCFVLEDDNGVIHGYVVSHPIVRSQPPALDSLLGEIAPDADQYYIHDLAILPGFRGRGFAAECIHRVLTSLADQYSTTCLISVYGTGKFWGRYGFSPEPVSSELTEKLRKYGGEAVFLMRQNGR